MLGDLKHVAFILDGNRRWAEKNGIPQLLGHRRGYENARDLIKYAGKYGIKYLTYYVFSVENWDRSKKEVDYLMDLFRYMLDIDFHFFDDEKIRVITIGDTKRLPNDITEKIKKLEEKTKNNTEIIVSIAISYSSRNEVVRACKKMLQDAISKEIKIDEITEDMFSSYLDTAEIPDPDMIIRTKENRLSNFLLWQSAYSEILFIDKFWPEFGEEDLEFAVDEFSKRVRRYGR